MFRAYLIGLCCWCSLTGLLAQAESEAFARGTAAYTQGRYVEAIQAYGGLVEAGYASPALYYNLANAYYRNGQTGPAVLYYEQALRLAPGDADVRANLQRVRDEVMDGALDVPPFFLTGGARALRDRLPAPAWAALALLAALLGAYGLYQWLGAAERRARKRGFGLFLLGALLLVPLAWLATSRQAVVRSSGVYIVLQNNLPLREAPSAEARRVATLPEGYRLERTDRIAPWVRVTMPAGTTGWVDATAGVREVR